LALSSRNLVLGGQETLALSVKKPCPRRSRNFVLGGQETLAEAVRIGVSRLALMRPFAVVRQSYQRLLLWCWDAAAALLNFSSL